MIKTFLLCLLFILLISCENNVPTIELNPIKDTIIHKNSNSIILANNNLETKIDSSKMINKLTKTDDNFTSKNKLKYPILMIIYKGCSGSITYKYDKRKYEIEKLIEYPDCPDNPNTTSKKGIILAKLPNYLSVCYKNFLIKKMTVYQPNYLELYNKEFKTNLRITKPDVIVNYPTILVHNSGNGGSTTYRFDTLNKKINRFDVMHNHSLFPDPNDCYGGKFVSKLPERLADSLKQEIINFIKPRYPNYENIYFTIYGQQIINRKDSFPLYETN